MSVEEKEIKPFQPDPPEMGGKEVNSEGEWTVGTGDTFGPQDLGADVNQEIYDRDIGVAPENNSGKGIEN